MLVCHLLEDFLWHCDNPEDTHRHRHITQRRTHLPRKVIVTERRCPPLNLPVYYKNQEGWSEMERRASFPGPFSDRLSESRRGGALRRTAQGTNARYASPRGCRCVRRRWHSPTGHARSPTGTVYHLGHECRLLAVRMWTVYTMIANVLVSSPSKSLSMISNPARRSDKENS